MTRERSSSGILKVEIIFRCVLKPTRQSPPAFF